MAVLVKTRTVSRLDIGPEHARHQSNYTQEDIDSLKNRSIKKRQNCRHRCRLLQASNRVSRNVCSQEKPRFLQWWPGSGGGGGGGRWGGGNVFTVHSFTERCAVCGEQRGPGPGNKSSCPRELQLGNNTTKLLHPGSGSHLSGGSFRFRFLDIWYFTRNSSLTYGDILSIKYLLQRIKPTTPPYDKVST